jgi:hypothetical protein
MPILGDFSTMCLSDLLRWAGSNAKTGVLEVERERICRRIEFRKGWVGACSSSDPAARLGQFLLARGKVNEEQLREALARQQDDRKSLGFILNEMGVLSRREIARQITLKAEETLYGLFDWEDAVFRYHEGAILDPDHIEVSLSIEGILDRGRQRHAELVHIRRTFPSSGLVLERRVRDTKSESLNRPMARRIIESIDGRRTIAEVLLHSNATEFVVLKFLHQLHAKGLLQIVGEQPAPTDRRTLLDRPTSEPRCVPWQAVDLAAFGPAQAPGVPPVEAPVAAAPATDEELDFEVQVASRLLARGEQEAALEVLNAVYRARPEDDYVRRLLEKTEQECIESLRRHPLSFHMVPLPAAQVPPEGLRPQEAFLLNMIDGRSDIQSMLWVTPLREVDVLVTLRRMLDRGLIALPDSGERRP